VKFGCFSSIAGRAAAELRAIKNGKLVEGDSL
jgi:hypothetical protein